MVMDTQHGEQDVREGVVYATEPLHFSAEAMQSSAEATEMDWYGENFIEEDALTPSSVEMDIALELEASETSQEDDPVHVRVLHIDDDSLHPQVVPTALPHAPMVKENLNKHLRKVVDRLDRLEFKRSSRNRMRILQYQRREEIESSLARWWRRMGVMYGVMLGSNEIEDIESDFIRDSSAKISVCLAQYKLRSNSSASTVKPCR